MSDDFVTGQRLGDYEILGVLGAGGMGKVYKVRNVISDRIEAMKVLLANLAGQKELADRFLREIKLLASLNHPNIAGLRTALTLDNQLVMIMEYVEGVTLASRLQQGSIPPPEAVNYTEQILGALGYAHHLNVIHRDVKPANMMLTPQGVVKLMDFGIARPNDEVGMTVTGATLGSLNYMSPEQVRGEPVDPRSDLYSVGVSLYEMVTAQLPFRGHSNYSVMSAHLQEVPAPPITVRPDLPQGLNDIILMAMAKDPQARFQSAEALGNALKSVFPGVGVPSVKPPGRVATVPMASTVSPSPIAPPAVNTSMPPPASHSGRRGVYMALGGLLVVGILFAAGFYLPRRIKTQANSSPISVPSEAPASPEPGAAPAVAPVSPAPDATAAPGELVAPTASVTPAVPASGTAVGVAQPRPHAAPGPLPHQSAIAAKPSQQDAVQQAAQQAADAMEMQQKATELADAEKQSDQLTSRAAAVTQGLDGLRRAQSAQGYGLRGDITAAEEIMKTDLARADAALQQKDGSKAKEYLDMAEVQTEKIEKFLGR